MTDYHKILNEMEKKLKYFNDNSEVLNKFFDWLYQCKISIGLYDSCFPMKRDHQIDLLRKQGINVTISGIADFVFVSDNSTLRYNHGIGNQSYFFKNRVNYMNGANYVIKSSNFFKVEIDEHLIDINDLDSFCFNALLTHGEHGRIYIMNKMFQYLMVNSNINIISQTRIFLEDCTELYKMLGD